MSATEDIVLLDSPIDIVLDEPRVEKKSKDSMGGETRKRLAEISNLPQQTNSTKDEKENCVLNATNNEYVNQLQKERKVLIQLLSDRNKIVELSGIELQKLRINLQKMQQQNLELAQANSQMLMELNASKDRLKELHHELGCKNGLLKARKLESERPKVRRYQRIVDQTGTSKSKDGGESSEAVNNDNELCHTDKKLKQSKSLGPSTGRQVPLKDRTENKRLSLRRQSARFKPEEARPAEDSFETEDAKVPVNPSRDDQMQEDGLTSMNSSTRKDDKEGGRSSVGDKTQYLKRSSIGRPLRQAATRVQSYKEVPLSVKLRRPE